MLNINISSQKLPDPSSLRDLFVSIGWGKTEEYDLATLQASSEGMTKIYTAYDGARLVGVARILSDGQTTTQLVDVIVSSSYQKQGIGRKLVKIVLEEYAHTAVYADAFEENAAFFQSCGLFNKTGKLISFSKAPVK